jgi:hypothetical protein
MTLLNFYYLLFYFFTFSAIVTDYTINVVFIKATCVLRTILELWEKIIVILLEIVGTKVAGEL